MTKAELKKRLQEMSNELSNFADDVEAEAADAPESGKTGEFWELAAELVRNLADEADSIESQLSE